MARHGLARRALNPFCRIFVGEGIELFVDDQEPFSTNLADLFMKFQKIKWFLKFKANKGVAARAEALEGVDHQRGIAIDDADGNRIGGVADFDLLSDGVHRESSVVLDADLHITVVVAIVVARFCDAWGLARGLLRLGEVKGIRLILELQACEFLLRLVTYLGNKLLVITN